MNKLDGYKLKYNKKRNVKLGMKQKWNKKNKTWGGKNNLERKGWA